MEGISEEAIALAGHWKLKKLIVFWDNNNITIDGSVDKSSSVDQVRRFEAAGWKVLEVDGHDQPAIAAVIEEAQKSDRPVLIACKTLIGFGAPAKQGTSSCHGAPLGAEERAAMAQNLQWNHAPFEVPADVLSAWRQAGKRSVSAYEKWAGNAMAAGEKFAEAIGGKLPKNWDKGLNALKNRRLRNRPKLPPAKLRSCVWKRLFPQCRKLSAVRPIWRLPT